MTILQDLIKKTIALKRQCHDIYYNFFLSWIELTKTPGKQQIDYCSWRKYSNFKSKNSTPRRVSQRCVRLRTVYNTNTARITENGIFQKTKLFNTARKRTPCWLSQREFCRHKICLCLWREFLCTDTAELCKTPVVKVCNRGCGPKRFIWIWKNSEWPNWY